MDANSDESEISSRCCVCARLRIGGTWQAADETVGVDERVSHTYCPPCLAAANPRRRTSGRALLVVPAPVNVQP